jgi:hypothetical protein
MKTTEISRNCVRSGFTKRVDTKAYWDAHGKAIPWDGSQVFRYPEQKKYELHEVEYRMESEYIKPYEYSVLELFIDGERLTDIGQITYFEELKTKLKLDCCVGAG